MKRYHLVLGLFLLALTLWVLPKKQTTAPAESTSSESQSEALVQKSEEEQPKKRLETKESSSREQDRKSEAQILELKEKWTEVGRELSLETEELRRLGAEIDYRVSQPVLEQEYEEVKQRALVLAKSYQKLSEEYLLLVEDKMLNGAQVVAEVER